jgi:hypothetical protein
MVLCRFHIAQAWLRKLPALLKKDLSDIDVTLRSAANDNSVASAVGTTVGAALRSRKATTAANAFDGVGSRRTINAVSHVTGLDPAAGVTSNARQRQNVALAGDAAVGVNAAAATQAPIDDLNRREEALDRLEKQVEQQIAQLTSTGTLHSLRAALSHVWEAFDKVPGINASGSLRAAAASEQLRPQLISLLLAELLDMLYMTNEAEFTRAKTAFRLRWEFATSTLKYLDAYWFHASVEPLWALHGINIMTHESLTNNPSESCAALLKFRYLAGVRARNLEALLEALIGKFNDPISTQASLFDNLFQKAVEASAVKTHNSRLTDVEEHTHCTANLVEAIVLTAAALRRPEDETASQPYRLGIVHLQLVNKLKQEYLLTYDPEYAAAIVTADTSVSRRTADKVMPLNFRSASAKNSIHSPKGVSPGTTNAPLPANLPDRDDTARYAVLHISLSERTCTCRANWHECIHLGAVQFVARNGDALLCPQFSCEPVAMDSDCYRIQRKHLVTVPEELKVLGQPSCDLDRVFGTDTARCCLASHERKVNLQRAAAEKAEARHQAALTAIDSEVETVSLQLGSTVVIDEFTRTRAAALDALKTANLRVREDSERILDQLHMIRAAERAVASLSFLYRRFAKFVNPKSTVSLEPVSDEFATMAAADVAMQHTPTQLHSFSSQSNHRRKHLQECDDGARQNVEEEREAKSESDSDASSIDSENRPLLNPEAASGTTDNMQHVPSQSAATDTYITQGNSYFYRSKNRRRSKAVPKTVVPPMQHAPSRTTTLAMCQQDHPDVSLASLLHRTQAAVFRVLLKAVEQAEKLFTNVSTRAVIALSTVTLEPTREMPVHDAAAAAGNVNANASRPRTSLLAQPGNNSRKPKELLAQTSLLVQPRNANPKPKALPSAKLAAPTRTSSRKAVVTSPVDVQMDVDQEIPSANVGNLEAIEIIATVKYRSSGGTVRIGLPLPPWDVGAYPLPTAARLQRHERSQEEDCGEASEAGPG